MCVYVLFPSLTYIALEPLSVPDQRILILGAKLQEVTVEENVAYWNCSDT